MTGDSLVTTTPTPTDTKEEDKMTEPNEFAMIAFLDMATPQVDWTKDGVTLRFSSWPPPLLRGYHEESAATLREAVSSAMARLDAPNVPNVTWACPHCNHTVRADATWSPDAEPSCGRCGTQMLVGKAADA